MADELKSETVTETPEARFNLADAAREHCVSDKLPEMLAEIAKTIKEYTDEHRRLLCVGYYDKTEDEREADRKKWDDEFYLMRTYGDVERIAENAIENRLYRDRTPAEREAASRKEEIEQAEKQLAYLRRRYEQSAVNRS